jgi:hypothetical protein
MSNVAEFKENLNELSSDDQKVVDDLKSNYEQPKTEDNIDPPPELQRPKPVPELIDHFESKNKSPKKPRKANKWVEYYKVESKKKKYAKLNPRERMSKISKSYKRKKARDLKKAKK